MTVWECVLIKCWAECLCFPALAHLCVVMIAASCILHCLQIVHQAIKCACILHVSSKLAACCFNCVGIDMLHKVTRIGTMLFITYAKVLIDVRQPCGSH